ncbi:DUF6531 domain-containing protein [Streptomyces sp. NPDC052396]|uniref:DUF6531 domain-containing protein n=1 Tax=Streptomyces sp. NPDC052396 TaxID=3365689 RepID=UPI0037CE7C85
MFGLPSIKDCCHWLANHMGMWWPDGDPGKCRQAAKAWRAFGKAVDDVIKPVNDKSAALIHNNKGEGIDAYEKFWRQYHAAEGKGWLDDVAGASRKMAEALEKYAAAIDHAIHQIEKRIAIDIAVLGAAIALAIATGGALSGAAAGVAAEVISLAGGMGLVVSEAAAEVLGTAIASAVFGGVESVAVDAAVAQPLQIATGLQDHFSLDELNASAKDGMISGGLFGGAGASAKVAVEAGGFRALAADFMPSLSRISGDLGDLGDLGALNKVKLADVETPSSPAIRPQGEDVPASARDTKSLTCDRDPIDVATGAMFLTQTDVTLPGQLPLVVGRTFLSSYRAGGWFGPAWASTLDERLQLDAKGVVFAVADGKLLCYPVPSADGPVLPEQGARLPLAWDGQVGGAMTVTDPATGLIRTFAQPARPSGQTIVELLLESVEDRNGHRIEIERTPAGVPTAIQHSGGYRIAIDTDGPRITGLRLLPGERSAYAPAADSGGTSLVRYGYDEAGHLTEVINSSGRPLKFGYDAQGRITSWHDRNGTSYAYVYDERGRVVRTEGSDGFLSGTLVYDEGDRTTTVTDSLGRRTVYQYNAARQVVAETDPLGHTTRTEWDPTGRHRLAVTDKLGRTTRYAYDDSGNLTSVTLPDGTTSHVTYNALNLPIEVAEPGGTVWRHAYDPAGNLLSTTDPSGAETRYTYDERGHLASITDALDNTQLLSCDAAGLPVSLTDAMGHTSTIRRDLFGRVVEVINPLGHTTRMGWTTEGKPKWRELPDGARESWTWDGEGNLLSHTDPAGNTTTHTTTHFDLPASRTDPDGTVYDFAYDTERRLTAVTNPQGLTWSYEYDAGGRLVSETDFNGRTVSYRRDAAGQLTSRSNGAGESLALVRDSLGRVIATRADDGTETAFEYDAAGHLVRAANPDAELVWQRDALGRVLAESVNGRTMLYAYDALGRRTRRTTPSGAVSHWTYDAADRPVRLRADGGSLDFGYDAAGREVERRLGGTVRLTQEWDARNRLTVQSLGDGKGLLLQHRAYAYRADDVLAEIRELTSGTRHFTLDAVGRVTGVNAHGWTESYAYDSVGNLTRAEAPGHGAGGAREFTGNVVRRAGRTRYEHDAQGRLIRRVRKLLNGQRRTWQFSWNAEDRLTEAVTPDGERWRYAYDPLGRRMAKSRLAEDGSTAEEITFAWDDTCVAEQVVAGAGTMTWDYAPGTHRPVAQTEREGLAEPESRIARLGAPPPRFQGIFTDLVGSPMELVTADGEITWQRRTSHWGTPLPTPAGEGAEAGCPLRFPGQYHDPETGLNYNYFRHYDPETARYVTPDPLGLAPAPNPFAYVVNALGWMDPLGLAPECLDPVPGKATVHAYTGPDGPHFSVEIASDSGKYEHAHANAVLRTTGEGEEQVEFELLKPMRFKSIPEGMTYVGSSTIDLTHADHAIAFAKKSFRGSSGQGVYDFRNNSCLVYCARVIEAGGGDAMPSPTDVGGLFKWSRKEFRGR